MLICTCRILYDVIDAVQSLLEATLRTAYVLERFLYIPNISKARGGHAMAQVVSHRPLTAEAWVRARVNPCGICGGQSCTGTGFSPSSSVFPCQ
jgi:hypothetical protein